MIVNIYLKRGKSRGRRGLPLTRIVVGHKKNLKEKYQKGKEIVKTGQVRPPPIFCPILDRKFYMGIRNGDAID
jgi:hypothetical protein